ncbi:metallo-beta-lactamase domain-containing protein 1-like [Amphiura filiformis]|uniref:metallo-beta-lactamase domain-containing protein 1-like n=1 Tax=Amphiura filiformis TaxID=82378 RepID=UPI003B2150B7
MYSCTEPTSIYMYNISSNLSKSMAKNGGVYSVHILKEGYSKAEEPGEQRACGTISLVKGTHKIIVDTGNPWDRELIVRGLASHGLCADDIDHVVCTHGHSDHVGNLNLFLNARHIVGYDVCQGDLYTDHPFSEGISLWIDDVVEVKPTPGHTHSDVSLIVHNTKDGVTVIAGDLFECEEDLKNPSIWKDNSEAPDMQESNRSQVLTVANVIVPGHGKLFHVTKTK